MAAAARAGRREGAAEKGLEAKTAEWSALAREAESLAVMEAREDGSEGGTVAVEEVPEAVVPEAATGRAAEEVKVARAAR